MCQAKDKGGKRCSVHQAGSKFSMRVAKLKTGADDATVKETFTELTKEGRPLPTPSKEEVEAFIEKKRFATELDPELDDHERKIELSQLARAEKELDSVTGASFHAWKNLRKRVAEKMKAISARIAKPMAALGLAGVVIFGAAGCGAQDTPSNPNAVAPAPTSSSAPASEPAATTLGDFVTTDKVTDEYGEYSHITISPNDDSMTDYSTIQASSVEAVGLTQEDAISAQQWVAKFAAEELLDSSALDGTTGWDNWVATKADSFLDPAQKDTILLPLETSDRSGLLVNNAKNAYPVFARDGAPREADGKVTIISVSGHSQDGGSYIKVIGSAQTNYRYTDASAISLLSSQGFTEDAIKASYPELYEQGDGLMPLNAQFTYYLSKKDNGGWQISGYLMKQDNNPH